MYVKEPLSCAPPPLLFICKRPCAISAGSLSLFTLGKVCTVHAERKSLLARLKFLCFVQTLRALSASCNIIYLPAVAASSKKKQITCKGHENICIFLINYLCRRWAKGKYGSYVKRKKSDLSLSVPQFFHLQKAERRPFNNVRREFTFANGWIARLFTMQVCQIRQRFHVYLI